MNAPSFGSAAAVDWPRTWECLNYKALAFLCASPLSALCCETQTVPHDVLGNAMQAQTNDVGRRRWKSRPCRRSCECYLGWVEGTWARMKKRFFAGSAALILFASFRASGVANHTSGMNWIGTFDLKDFGAVCDGRQDDTKAIRAWLNKLAENVRLIAPAGVCLFSAPLKAPFAKAYDISGAGPYATTFKYVGSSTTPDLLTISDTGHAGEIGISIRDFRIASETKMTGGYAFHAHGLFHSVVSNVVLDGAIEGTGNLCGGYWFDGAGGVDLENPNGYSTQFCGDGVLINSALGGAAELRMVGGTIGGGFVNGIHMAGGFGGVRCDGTNIHQNKYNLLIDNALTPKGNREFDQGSTCELDSAIIDGALVDDSFAGGGTVDFAGWEASAQTGSGIHIKQWRNGDVEIRGDKVYNNCLDGIYVEDPTTHVFIAVSVAINHNGNSRLGGDGRCLVPPGRGWGVNAASPTDNILGRGTAWNNTAGSFGPNVRALHNNDQQQTRPESGM